MPATAGTLPPSGLGMNHGCALQVFSCSVQAKCASFNSLGATLGRVSSRAPLSSNSLHSMSFLLSFFFGASLHSSRTNLVNAHHPRCVLFCAGLASSPR